MIRELALGLLFSIAAGKAKTNVKRPDKPDPKQKSFQKPIFVFEMISHAASASEQLPEGFDVLEYFGVEKGKITKKGMSEAYKIGMKRK